MSLTREDRIELIRQVQELRDRIEAVMEILMPTPEVDADGNCTHPPYKVTNESTMGEPLWVCQCGASQDHPFTVSQ